MSPISFKGLFPHNLIISYSPYLLISSLWERVFQLTHFEGIQIILTIAWTYDPAWPMRKKWKSVLCVYFVKMFSSLIKGHMMKNHPPLHAWQSNNWETNLKKKASILGMAGWRDGQVPASRWHCYGPILIITEPSISRLPLCNIINTLIS